jgi:hypothetical protein
LLGFLALCGLRRASKKLGSKVTVFMCLLNTQPEAHGWPGNFGGKVDRDYVDRGGQHDELHSRE